MQSMTGEFQMSPVSCHREWLLCSRIVLSRQVKEVEMIYIQNINKSQIAPLARLPCRADYSLAKPQTRFA
jgi:hypothetical protein